MRCLKLLFLLTSVCLTDSLLAASTPFIPSGEVIRIWPADAPGSEGKSAQERWVEGSTPDAFHRVTDIHVPTLTVYLPPKDKANGTAIIIAPGGAHRYLVVDLEGEFVAQKLNAMGIAAFVLRSRLANAEGSTYKVEVESLADLHIDRASASWGFQPADISRHLPKISPTRQRIRTSPSWLIPPSVQTTFRRFP
jgi:hypothetical protein